MLDILWVVLLIIFVPSCIGLIAIVLLQKGKGSGFAGAFGMGGGTDAVFGPRGGQTLVVRLTYVAAANFMVIALLMSIIAGKVGRGDAPEFEDVEEGSGMVSRGLLDDLGIGGTGEDTAETPSN